MRTGLPGKRSAPQHVVVDSQPLQPSSGGGGGGGTVDQGAAGASPWPVTDATAEAKLEAIRVLLAGTVGTSDTTAQGLLTAIEGLLAGTLTVAGAVAVSNFPATQPVSAAALPLPSGASTESTLALIKAKTDNLDVALSTRTKPGDTQPISASTLPLPSNAAQEAGGNLAAARTDLDNIATRTPSLGQAAMAGSSPVVIASDQIVSVDLQSDGTPGVAAPAQVDNVGGTDAAGLLRALRVDTAGTASVGTTRERQFMELQYLREADQVRQTLAARGRERIPILSERGGGR